MTRRVLKHATDEAALAALLQHYWVRRFASHVAHGKTDFLCPSEEKAYFALVSYKDK